LCEVPGVNILVTNKQVDKEILNENVNCDWFRKIKKLCELPKEQKRFLRERRGKI
jgi:hypothetical protein